MKMIFPILRWIPILAGLAGLAGCAAPQPMAGQATRSAGQTAVTYAGILPCADCEGQLIVLTLFPDATFRMRTSYQGSRSGTHSDLYELGRWSSPEGTAGRYLLRGTSAVPLQFAKQESGSLRLLDQSGQPIVSRLNYELQRQKTIDTVSGPMRLRGMYVYQADAASLTECVTGKRLPVLLEGDHLALERAYLADRRQPGEAILVSLNARFVERAPEAGMPVREHLLVETFGRISPGESCVAAGE